ncbi:MAG: TIGR02266 family protein [Myxococcales bacterium]|nr:TIGR02266 family protein [Myxococcales bacterium]
MTDELQDWEKKLDAREASVAEKRSSFERRRFVLGELRDTVREREASLRTRATRLQVELGELGRPHWEAALETAHEAEFSELDRDLAELREERRRQLARREALLDRQDTLVAKALARDTGAEEALLAREQAITEAFRRLVLDAGDAGGTRATLGFDQNRRQHPRIEVRLSVHFGSEHNFIAAESENLSAGGLFVSTRDRLQEGREVELRIHLEGEGELAVTGIVSWQRRDTDPGGPGFGVRFTRISPAAERAIARFIERRPPSVGPHGHG